MIHEQVVLEQEMRAYVADYEAVQTEKRLFLQRIYWVSFYYLVMIAGAVGTFASLLGAKPIDSPEASALLKHPAVLFGILGFGVVSCAVQFFGLFWFFQVVKANLYSGVVAERASLLLGRPVFRLTTVPFRNPLPTLTDMLLRESHDTVDRLIKWPSGVMLGMMTAIPTAVALAILICTTVYVHDAMATAHRVVWGFVVLLMTGTAVYAIPVLHATRVRTYEEPPHPEP